MICSLSTAIRAPPAGTTNLAAEICSNSAGPGRSRLQHRPGRCHAVALHFSLPFNGRTMFRLRGWGSKLPPTLNGHRMGRCSISGRQNLKSSSHFPSIWLLLQHTGNRGSKINLSPPQIGGISFPVVLLHGKKAKPPENYLCQAVNYV